MNLPKEAQEAAQRTIDTMYGNRQSLSFVLSYIPQNQYAMELIYSINSFLEKENSLEIAIYTAYNEWNYLIPFCSIYNILDVKNRRTPKVIADPLTFQSTPIINYDSVYYYCYNPNLFRITKKEVIEQIIGSKCRFIVRSKSHKDFLKKHFGITAEPMLVPMCEIELLRKIIYG